MRRLIYLLLLVLFVSASATCVNASTDCERWFIAYRRELAHSRQVQRIAAAKRRAKRKLAQYLQPKPKPKVILARSPRMTRKQTLHHFDLACGVLPEDDSDEPVIAEETPPPFNGHALDDGFEPLPVAFDQLIAENDLPPQPVIGNVTPDYPSSGGPPIYAPPFTGGFAPGGGGPGSGTTLPPGSPGTPPTTPPDTPDVPEPASYVLLLTGMVGAAGAFRSRFKS